MVLSLEHSSPLAQQRQHGRSGRGSSSSSSHRVTQSNILTLRATSRTCFLWVMETPSPSKPLSSLPLSLRIILFSWFWNRTCCLCWTSLVPSTTMTSRCPCTLSSTSDFCFSAVLLSVSPPDLLYLQLLCAGLTYSLLALHGFSCTACRSTPLCFIYLAPVGNRRSHRPGVYSLLLNLQLKHSPPPHPRGSTWCQWWNKLLFRRQKSWTSTGP